jgi:hypothetical protein
MNKRGALPAPAVPMSLLLRQYRGRHLENALEA